MSTRALIAVKTPTGYKGVYHHYDGDALREPIFYFIECLGTEGAVEHIIDQHPGGWSSLHEGICYCHSKQFSDGRNMTMVGKDLPYGDYDYTWLFDLEARTLTVYNYNGDVVRVEENLP